MDESDYEAMYAALKAVAPMLASARIQELSLLLSEAKEHHLACIKDAYRLLGIDGSDGEYRYKRVALELAKLASARVPEELVVVDEVGRSVP